MAATATHPQITAGYLALALRLQEAAGELSASDTCARLRDALNDAFRGSGSYCYYIDHFGDDASGDVIYSCGGDTRRAAYEISGGNGTAAVCTIATDSSENVVPRTVYEVEADEADHYAGMEESFKRDKLYTELPLYERFISKTERASMDSSDFAGKNKSFPVKAQADVMAAMHSLGRAGSDNYSTSVIRANIIKIAKKKGFTLPKSAQGEGDKAKESRGAAAGGSLKLVESTAWAEDLRLIESTGKEIEIKLIAPGKGSSAYYPAEVLKRDGPAIFKKDTQIYINHATAVEEAQRPEGDWHKLAGALATDSYWKESAKHGAGLFAMAKFASDIAPAVIEKAPYSGMSIRANGDALKEAGKTVMREGLPVLGKFTSVESVDVVTKAGAGGMILTEAARGAESQQEVSDMDAAELKKLQESQTALQETNRRLLERALRADAKDEATRLLESVTLPPPSKLRIVETVCASVPTKDGEIDKPALKTAVEAAAKREGEYLTSVLGEGARPRGMGAAATATEDPVKVAEAQAREEKSEKKRLKESRKIFESLGMSKDAAKVAAEGRAS
jgi:hypothetical protein